MIANKIGNYGVMKVGYFYKGKQSRYIFFLFRTLLFTCSRPISTNSTLLP